VRLIRRSRRQLHGAEVIVHRTADEPVLLIERLGKEPLLLQIGVYRGSGKCVVRRRLAVARNVLQKSPDAHGHRARRDEQEIEATAVDIRMIHVVSA